jgi:polyribonucleotide 5'-hydroxyl-kinase
MTNIDSLPPPVDGAERHILKAEEELRLEVSFSKSCQFQLTLLQGSAELWGVELASNTPYTLSPDSGGLKIAIFTWHGCVIDVLSPDGSLEMAYTSDETSSNVAAVNTHAQLEALRDAAAMNPGSDGPRVLIVGPTESGKSSLSKVLIAYAVKLGRTPVAVDLDPNDNGISVPGTLAACVMGGDTLSLQSYATSGLPVTQQQLQSQPLVLWHGGTQLSPDLFRAQVAALGRKIDQRLQHDDWARSSGLIVNTNGWIQEEGFQLLLHTVTALRITVVLVMGHDRLYSMMRNAIAKKEEGSNIKVIKVPRSGGVVSRSANYMMSSRSRSIRRYFYGGMMEAPSTTSSTSTATTNASHRWVPQLTPFALQISFAKLQIYKLSALSLSSALLPVAAAQTTEPVQLQSVTITEQLQHSLLAVCHPQAVGAYEASGQAKDLYESGVAGFVMVERIVMDHDMIHLLSPCAGSLATHTLISGDITWME